MGKVQDGRPMSNKKMIYFWTEQLQAHNFGVYYMVFRNVRSSGGVRNYIRHCIAGKIQGGRYLYEDKQYKLV